MADLPVFFPTFLRGVGSAAAALEMHGRLWVRWSTSGLVTRYWFGQTTIRSIDGVASTQMWKFCIWSAIRHQLQLRERAEGAVLMGSPVNRKSHALRRY